MLSLQDVKDAQARIAPYVVRPPCCASPLWTPPWAAGSI